MTFERANDRVVVVQVVVGDERRLRRALVEPALGPAGGPPVYLRDSVESIFTSADAAEAFTAMVEKRPPRYVGS